MQTIEEIKEYLDELTTNIKSLEEALLKAVYESKTENDTVLRELTNYLSSTANQVKQLNSLVLQVSTSTAFFNSYSIKIDSIENKITLLPQDIQEINSRQSEMMKLSSEKSNKNLNVVFSYLKSMNSLNESRDKKIEKIEENMSQIYSIIKKISLDISNNQAVTRDFLNKMIDGNLAIAKSNIEAKKNEMSGASNLEIEKVKSSWDFKTKVILALISSGGILLIIVQAIISLFFTPKPPI